MPNEKRVAEGFWYIESDAPVGYEIAEVVSNGAGLSVYLVGTELPFRVGDLRFIAPVQPPSTLDAFTPDAALSETKETTNV